MSNRYHSCHLWQHFIECGFTPYNFYIGLDTANRHLFVGMVTGFTDSRFLLPVEEKPQLTIEL